MFTSALPTLRQALRQLPHAVGTAGPQLQGSERTGHRWTSTWDLPSSVSTAGPQRPDRMSEDMPEDMPDRMPEDMPENMPARRYAR